MQIIALQTGYDALREIKGPDEALKWYLGRIPADKSGNEGILITLLQDGEFELVRAVAAAHPPSQNPMAVASLCGRLTLTTYRFPTRWSLVRSLMPRPRPQAETMFASVHYLMHEAEESAVFAAVSNATDRTEAPFFIGVRAVGEGDYDKALGTIWPPRGRRVSADDTGAVAPRDVAGRAAFVGRDQASGHSLTRSR